MVSLLNRTRGSTPAFHAIRGKPRSGYRYVDEVAVCPDAGGPTRWWYRAAHLLLQPSNRSMSTLATAWPEELVHSPATVVMPATLPDAVPLVDLAELLP